MNILFLTQIVPYPPDAGPKVKTYHVLRSLVGQGHSVTLVSFVRPEEVPHVPPLEGLCQTVHVVPIRRSRLADGLYFLRSILKGRPFLIERDDLQPMRDLVFQLVKDGNFQFIHADQLTMVQFALRAAHAFPDKKPKVIFDAHNAVWTIVERMLQNAHGYLKPFLRMEAAQVKRYEGSLLGKVDHVLAVTEMDRSALLAAFDANARKGVRRAPITVVPIAVDTQKQQPVHRRHGSRNIVTLGTLHYPPNADGIRWFFNEVFPLIRRRVPDATLTIIGKNPPRDFLDLGTREPKSIRITGYVPALGPWLEKAALMVVPVRAGGGMRVRILEAFAFAMPVVTTTIGLEGIQAECGKDVLIADSAQDFADCVVELLENDAMQAELALCGRHLAETHYDWHTVLSAMKPIYQ